MADCFLRRRTNQGGNIPIVSWSSGTPTEIKAMLDAHDAGKINIYNIWSIGDERTAHLSAIAADPYGAFTTAMDAQDVVMVLMNEGYMEQQGIHYVVGQKDLLSQNGRITSGAGYNGSWKNSLIRSALNNSYYNAFDSDFKSLFKQFDVRTLTTYDSFTTEITQDYFALCAEKEVFGTNKYSSYVEAINLSQFAYYETSSNIRKKRGDTAESWWERSPCTWNGNVGNGCLVYENATKGFMASNNTLGIAPFGCI